MGQKKRQVTIEPQKYGLNFEFNSPISSKDAAKHIAWIYGKQTEIDMVYLTESCTLGGYAVPYILIGPKTLKSRSIEEIENHPMVIHIYQIPPQGEKFQTIEKQPQTRINQFRTSLSDFVLTA